MWPNRRLLDLLNVDLPIIQAPMAGSTGAEMAIEVSNAGGLGSLPCALLSADQIRSEIRLIREKTNRPINLNFFCHKSPKPDSIREARWKQHLAPYYRELGLDPDGPASFPTRTPFNEQSCEIVEEFRPEVVSFHFGLPEAKLLERVKSTGAKVLSSATSVKEARWLEAQGCDAIIAQGLEAGGHSGMFLSHSVTTLVGTFALVPQIADAVNVPVIAAGGIADARGIAAAFMLGASGVQIGTAYLFCPEAKISSVYRSALESATDDGTALTDVITGRPARGIVNRLIREMGPLSQDAPEFPDASTAVMPLRMKAELTGSADFSPLWAGQAARLSRKMSATELTLRLARETLSLLQKK
jgi:nitronate monooxygenase